jgi:hypothetical protein
MRFIVALLVFAVGVGFYAAAALLFDRRRLLLGRSVPLPRLPVRQGGPDGPVRVAADPVMVYLTILGCLVIGTALMLGACVGVIRW